MNWHLRRRLTSAFFAAGLSVTLAVGVASIVVGLDTVRRGDEIARVARDGRIARNLLIAAIDAETGARGYLVAESADYLEPFHRGLAAMDAILALPGDPVAAAGRNRDNLRRLLEDHRAILMRAVATARDGGFGEARRMLVDANDRAAMDAVRRAIGDIDETVQVQLQQARAGLDRTQSWFVIGMIAFVVLSIVFLTIEFILFRQEISSRANVEARLAQRNRELNLVGALADSLRAATSREESYRLIERFAAPILSDYPGTLHIYNNSRDALAMSAAWGRERLEPDALEPFRSADCWAIRRGKPFIAAAGDPVSCPHVHHTGGSQLCLPLAAAGNVIGLLHLRSANPDSAAAFGDLQWLVENFAEQLSLALVNIELNEKLRNMALRDTLTGLYNRRFLDEILVREIHQVARTKASLALILADLDHFKRLNDTFGHQAGDDVLKEMGALLLRTVRRTDIPCRYGGEEFAIVLPACDAADALTLAEQIRLAVAGLRLRSGTTDLPPLTISLGIAVYPDIVRTGAELLPAADRALYRAKASGRDRSVLFAVDRAAVSD